MLGRLSSSLAVASLAVSLFSWSSPVSAAIEPIGAVVATNGPFIAIQTDKSARSLTRGSEFYESDRLWTGPRTKAQIRFSDGAIMTLRPDTEFSVDEYEFDATNAANNKSLFTLVKGGFRTLTGLVSRLRPDSYKVKTTYAIVGVRGTTYETVIDSGLYVAAWQGTVSVGNDESELLLGFGQDFNYARVTSPNSAPTGLLQTPPQLLETIDPQLQEASLDPTEVRLTTGLLQDGVGARLTSAELASLDGRGVAVSNSANVPSILQGDSNDLAGSNPILFDIGADMVLRRGTALSVNSATDTSLASFPVSWGEWNGGVVQPDSQNAATTIAVNSPVFWITALPAASVPATGTATYTNVVGFQGRGDGGAINSIDLGAIVCSTCGVIVDFGTASVNGRMIVQNGISPTDTWDASFAGKINGGSISASVNPVTSTFSDGGLPAVSGVTGNVSGTLTGPAAEGIAGGFDFRSGSNNYVQGTVFVKQ